jgi:hypothetical protein
MLAAAVGVPTADLKSYIRTDKEEENMTALQAKKKPVSGIEH